MHDCTRQIHSVSTDKHARAWAAAESNTLPSKAQPITGKACGAIGPCTTAGAILLGGPLGDDSPLDVCPKDPHEIQYVKFSILIFERH